LTADVAMICDTNMWDKETPAITTSLRGLCAEEIFIHASDRDLHSGFYGSAAVNPNHVLARIIADLRDADGRITIPGFYEGVPEPSPALLDGWSKLGFSERRVPGRGGPFGACGRKGPLGAGTDLVAPDLRGERHGRRLSGRRVQDGDPCRCLGQDQLPAGVRPGPRTRSAPPSAISCARVPADCRVEFTEHGSGRAVAFEVSAPVFQKTQKALSDEWGKEAAFVGGGGSIPVTTMIKEKLGLDVVMAGFGLSDDRIHSPNEKYSLTSFHKGIRSWARVLAAL
jgi:acetylornithine deacetylase/succinyl-diaminopimelate desuccinylase-like protein